MSFACERTCRSCFDAALASRASDCVFVCACKCACLFACLRAYHGTYGFRLEYLAKLNNTKTSVCLPFSIYRIWLSCECTLHVQQMFVAGGCLVRVPEVPLSAMPCVQDNKSSLLHYITTFIEVGADMSLLPCHWLSIAAHMHSVCFTAFVPSSRSTSQTFVPTLNALRTKSEA